MNRIKNCAASMLMLVLGACASSVPVIDFYEADTDTLRRFQQLNVLPSEDFPDGQYRSLGDVEGIVCRRSIRGTDIYSPKARLVAIDQVKLKAAESGANAITAPQCDVQEEADFSNNCMAKVYCMATALQQI